MQWSNGLISGLAAALSVVLFGCSGGGNPDTKTTVLVMRHCVRSTHENGIHDLKQYTFYNNYSENPWPPFKVAPMYCLQRGLDIVEGSGKWFKEHVVLPEPLQVIADDCERDNLTARSFLAGFGQTLEQARFTVDAGPFIAAKSPDCPALSKNDVHSALSKQLDTFPKPSSFSELLAEVQAAMGVGAAQNWTSVECTVAEDLEWPYLQGACQAASEFVERFIMEWGGGMSVGWGHVQLDRLPVLLKLHAWFRQVVCAAPEIVATSQASISRAILAALEAEKGTTVFVGHDTQLNALSGALNLAWNAHPFPANATLPGSVLRFEREGDTIRASYFFVTNFSDSTGSMTTVPVSFLGSSATEDDKTAVSVTDFRELVEKGSIAACATNATIRSTSEGEPAISAVPTAKPASEAGEGREFVV
eukprot:gnl/TRDRNA2_/TRDRNA2_83107_c0_seq1.p1 gnl/TRDRNA2_/TRDRNA2_83107_c0~~gnl/TRDRNA2_/TRDRNA2_83107_c0_seq1.p1  ORF type:complete len:419 (-),score=68.68 gnl/TRDRNA2_/TRDRNA2_83107_c0_seq1:58-1314(-)